VKRSLLLAFLLLFVSGFIFSFDFGVDLDQKFEIENDLFTSDTSLTPWSSFEIGKNVSAYLSGILTLRYISFYNDDFSNGDLIFIPELSRFSLICRINEKMSLEAGRMEFSDAINFTASGLFDGIRFKVELPAGSLGISVLLTGFLYKETASIVMTGRDAADYAVPFDGKNYDYYRASNRMLMSARWDMPLKLPKTEDSTLSADLLTQFDLNNDDDFLNSQYGSVLLEFYPKDMLRVTGGLLFGTMQNSQGLGTAFGFLARCKTDIPFTKAADLISVTAKATYGSTDNGFNSYQPVSGVSQGFVFEGTLSALASLSVDYNIKITDSFFSECAFRYFISTFDNSDNNLYGGEFWASLAWQPFEELLVYLGGGVFLPGMGNVYPKDTDVMWKVIIGVTLSF